MLRSITQRTHFSGDELSPFSYRVASDVSLSVSHCLGTLSLWYIVDVFSPLQSIHRRFISLMVVVVVVVVSNKINKTAMTTVRVR